MPSRNTFGPTVGGDFPGVLTDRACLKYQHTSQTGKN